MHLDIRLSAPRLLISLAVLALSLGGCAPARPQASSTRPSLALSDCLLSAPLVPIRRAALCGSLNVPENPAAPAGRQISLSVAVIKAESSSPAADPVFLLAGGPGQAASEAFLPMISALDKIAFKHDLVLVDQRGTGKSNPLLCEEPAAGAPVGSLVGPAESAAAYRACLARWDADPRYYATANHVDDLEAVRQALGYGQIDLLGISYGTRAALAYLKAHPQNVRAFVIDGVVPPGWVLGETAETDAAQAIDALFSRCQAEPGCAAAFPDPRGDLRALLERLGSAGQTLTIPEPASGKDIQVALSAQSVPPMLRQLSYSSSQAALLPLLIHLAAQGDLRPLAAQVVIAERYSGGVYGGLHYAVVCAEDAPFLPPKMTEGLYTQDLADTIRSVCAEYNLPPQPASARDFPSLQTPGLILSGSADPVTPPANGEAAAKLLPAAVHIVLEGMGHSNVTQGCIPNLISQLFADGSTAQLETQCAGRVSPPAFFTNPTGPEP